MWLQAPVLERSEERGGGSQWSQPKKGTPQGGVAPPAGSLDGSEPGIAAFAMETIAAWPQTAGRAAAKRINRAIEQTMKETINLSGVARREYPRALDAERFAGYGIRTVPGVCEV